MTEPDTGPAEATAPAGETAEFRGDTFKLNADVSEWAVLEFAAAADAGEDAGTFQGLASMYNFVIELVHPDDRDRFRSLCRRERVGSNDLFEFMFGKKLEAAGERPTGRSSDSSDGPTVTDLNSAANSDDKGSRTGGLRLLEGRPDLRVALEASTRAS